MLPEEDSPRKDTSERKTTNVNVVKISSFKVVTYKGTSQLTQGRNPSSVAVTNLQLEIIMQRYIRKENSCQCEC